LHAKADLHEICMHVNGTDVRRTVRNCVVVSTWRCSCSQEMMPSARRLISDHEGEAAVEAGRFGVGARLAVCWHLRCASATAVYCKSVIDLRHSFHLDY